jgi:hypothetical protein
VRFVVCSLDLLDLSGLQRLIRASYQLVNGDVGLVLRRDPLQLVTSDEDEDGPNEDEQSEAELSPTWNTSQKQDCHDDGYNRKNEKEDGHE